jgi:putative ABC transport system permease protein
MKPTPRPPRFAHWLLLRFLRDDLAEEVAGDLDEKFFQTLKEKSSFRAKVNYWFQVINYLRPFAMRKSKSFHFNQADMFQNYFKITTRNLVKQKLYSVINIGGLTLGLTCFLLIFLYVQHEFSYNQFYPDVDRIYKVYQKQSGNVFLGTDYFSVTPARLASNLKQEFAEVENATTVQEASGLLSVEERSFWQTGLSADNEFFQVLQRPLLLGDVKTALADAKAIVLTKSLAETIFGDKNPIGQFVRYKDEDGYHVTAVVDDPPLNSSLKYSFIVSILYNEQYVEDMKRSGWNNNSVHTFFLLREGALISALEEKFPALLKKYQLPADYAGYPFKDQYFAMPLMEMYFHPNINFELGIKGNRSLVYLFSVVALVVLLLACVNYMNLAVARSIKRAREVGLRKVVGALRSQLIIQFLGESLLIAFVSLLFAIGLTYLFLPYFGQMMDRPVSIDFLSNSFLIPSLLALVLLVGFFSGSYPALVMSGWKPVDVMKAKSDVKVSGFSLQRLLIIAQFAVSITLVIGSMIIFQQLDFIKKKELGYNKEDVITIRVRDYSLLDKFETLSNEWQRNTNIVSATMSSALPTDISSSNLIHGKDGSSEKVNLAIYQWRVEPNFLDVYGMQLVAGKNFSSAKEKEENACMVNEAAVKALGWTPEESIGKQIYRGENHQYPSMIMGVVKDFHMHSMHLPIQPLMIRSSGNRPNYFSVRIKHESALEVIPFLEKSIRKNSPYPFDYLFLEDHFNQLYSSEMKLGEIFGFFTLVSILIAAMGLFGLAAFLSAQRTKEIGIRKVLGASVQSIVLLMSRDFLMLVVVAFVIAIPAGWYLSSQWLQDFAYRINIEWWTFAVAGGLALLIAKLSVGYQSLKASLANPVDSLRSE